MLAIGDPPAEFILGPFTEAEVAYGGPGDLPELWREVPRGIESKHTRGDDYHGRPEAGAGHRLRRS